MVKPVVDVAVPALVILMMAIVGLQLTVADFGRIARRPFVVCVATIAQAILLPLLGAALLSVVDLKPHIAKGLILVVACPAGSMANLHSYVARANVALSVTLGAVSCVAAVLTMRVENRGTGFDLTAAHSQPGLGLSSMEERVRLIRGSLCVTSAPGQGTAVAVRVPLGSEP